MESCEKEVSGVKTDKRIQATQPNSVFVSLEESFRPKFAHQRPQKTTIQILALEGKAAYERKWAWTDQPSPGLPTRLRFQSGPHNIARTLSGNSTEHIQLGVASLITKNRHIITGGNREAHN